MCQKYLPKFNSLWNLSMATPIAFKMKSRLFKMTCENLPWPVPCLSLWSYCSASLLLLILLCLPLGPCHLPHVPDRHTLLALAHRTSYSSSEPDSSPLLPHFSSLGSICLECHYLPLVNLYFKNHLQGIWRQCPLAVLPPFFLLFVT